MTETDFIPEQKDHQSPRIFYAPEGYKRLTINLPEELHRKLKLTAIHRDCTATDIIQGLLERDLQDSRGMFSEFFDVMSRFFLGASR
jgi:hypothetical protein